jgi:hypothetical protein
MTYTANSSWVANSSGASALESAPSSVPPHQYVNVTIDLQVPAASSQYLGLRVRREKGHWPLSAVICRTFVSNEIN